MFGATFAASGGAAGEIILPFTAYQSLSPITTDVFPYNLAIPFNVTLTKITVGFYLQGLQDLSNYWNFNLIKPDGSPVVMLNTAPFAAGAWSNVSKASFLIPSILVTDGPLFFWWQRTGTPGACLLGGATLLVIRS